MTKLYDRISERSRRLFVLRAATEGLRIDLEREFQRETSRKISRLLAALSKTLKYDGTLSLSFRQSQLVKRLPYAERKEAMNEFLDLAFNPLRFSDFKNSSEIRAMNVTYRKWIKIMYEFGAVTALRTMGVRGVSRKVQSIQRRLEVAKAPEEFIFELTDTEIIHQLDNRAINYGRGLSDEIIMDSRRLVRDNIYLGDLGVQETAIQITTDSSIPLWRGLKIARTETQQAFNTAANDMYKRSGVKKHTWSTVGDRRVRPAHADNDGTTVEIGKSFPSGQLHPGDGPGSINCRCSVFPDLSDPNILLQPWNGKGGVPTVTDPPGGITPKPRKPRTKSPFSLHKEAKNKLKKADAKIVSLEKKMQKATRTSGNYEELKFELEQVKAARLKLANVEKAAREAARKEAQDLAAIAQGKLDKAKVAMEAADKKTQKLLSTLNKDDPKDFARIKKAMDAQDKANGRYYAALDKSKAADDLVIKYKPPGNVKSGDEIVQLIQKDLDRQVVLKGAIKEVSDEMDEIRELQLIYDTDPDAKYYIKQALEGDEAAIAKIEEYHSARFPDSGWRARRSRGIGPKSLQEQVDEILEAGPAGKDRPGGGRWSGYAESERLMEKYEKLWAKRHAQMSEMSDIAKKLDSTDMKLKIIGEVKHGDDGMVIVTENITDVKRISTTEGGLVDAVAPTQDSLTKLDEAATFVEDVVPKDRIEKGIVALEKRAAIIKEERLALQEVVDNVDEVVRVQKEAIDRMEEAARVQLKELSDEYEAIVAANKKRPPKYSKRPGRENVELHQNPLDGTGEVFAKQKKIRDALTKAQDDLYEIQSNAREVRTSLRRVKGNEDWVVEKLENSKASLRHVEKNGANKIKYVNSADDRAYAINNRAKFEVDSDGVFETYGRDQADAYDPAMHLSHKNGTSVHIHEMFHIMENDGFLDDSISFIRYRAVDPKTVKKVPKLAEKTQVYPGSTGNKAKEVAWEDEFWNKYQGKHYGNDSSEIATMYMQQMYDDPVALIRADPEGFAFMVDTLRGVPMEEQKWFMKLSPKMKKFVLNRSLE